MSVEVAPQAFDMDEQLRQAELAAQAQEQAAQPPDFMEQYGAHMISFRGETYSVAELRNPAGPCPYLSNLAETAFQGMMKPLIAKNEAEQQQRQESERQTRQAVVTAGSKPKSKPDAPARTDSTAIIQRAHEEHLIRAVPEEEKILEAQHDRITDRQQVIAMSSPEPVAEAVVLPTPQRTEAIKVSDTLHRLAQAEAVVNPEVSPEAHQTEAAVLPEPLHRQPQAEVAAVADSLAQAAQHMEMMRQVVMENADETDETEADEPNNAQSQHATDLFVPISGEIEADDIGQEPLTIAQLVNEAPELFTSGQGLSQETDSTEGVVAPVEAIEQVALPLEVQAAAAERQIVPELAGKATEIAYELPGADEVSETMVDDTFHELIAEIEASEPIGTKSDILEIDISENDINLIQKVITDEEPVPMVAFREFVAERQEPQEPQETQEYQEQQEPPVWEELTIEAREEPLEDTLAVLAATLQLPERRKVTAEPLPESQQEDTAESILEIMPEPVTALIQEIAAELETLDEELSDEAVKLLLTPELTRKLLIFVRALGYEDPQAVLVEAVKSHDLRFVLDGIGYLSDIIQEDQHREKLFSKSFNPIMELIVPIEERIGKIVLPAALVPVSRLVVQG